jgi:bla regulator protein BlaR1
MNALTTWLPEPFLRAICWSLVYSLGWGVLAAALTGIVLLLTKKMRAVVRYFSLVSILLLFALTTFFTFYQQLALAASSEPFAATISAATGADGPAVPLAIVAGRGTVVDALAAFCNRYSTVIVLTWLLVIALRCTRLVIDLRRVHHLTKHQVTMPGDAWNERLTELSARLRIRIPVRLLQSAIIKVPVTLGHLKPIILIPAGILTSIPPQQIEAILLHELAHIRRRDYMINILQRSIEILFFFNPAVLWISALIKEERENCCDDIVISHTDNRVGYVSALVAFQEYHLAAPVLAPALTDSKGHLLARVKRILYNTNKTLDGMEKTLLITGMAIAGFFFFSSLRVRERVAGVKQVVLPAVAGVRAADAVVNVADTLPDVSRSKAAARNATASEPSVIEAVVEGKHYKFTQKDNVITELYINGKKISVDDLAGYQSLTMIAPLLSNAHIDNIKMQKALLDAQYPGRAINDLLLRSMKTNMDKAWKDMRTDSLLLDNDRQKLLDDAQQKLVLNDEQQKLSLDDARQNLLMQKMKAEKVWKDMKMDTAAWNNTSLMLAKENAELELLSKKNADRLMLEINPKGENSLDRYIDPIIDDLIDYKVIGEDNRESLSFELNDQGLTVNGVRQPQELFMKFKAKYIKHPDDLFRLTVKNKTNRSITVNIH